MGIAAAAFPAADKYPKPPYKKRSQAWPGLASQMDPRPDHGEKSYRGSGRLAGRRALATGGDSGMGRAAAIAYAREGADVAINHFPTEEPDGSLDIIVSKLVGSRHAPRSWTSSSEDFDATMKQYLRAILDHQGRASSPQARLGHHRHCLGAGVPPIPGVI